MIQGLRRRLIDHEPVTITDRDPRTDGLRAYILFDSECREIVAALERDLDRASCEANAAPALIVAQARRAEAAEKRAERLEAAARELVAEAEPYGPRPHHVQALRAALAPASGEEGEG